MARGEKSKSEKRAFQDLSDPGRGHHSLLDPAAAAGSLLPPVRYEEYFVSDVKSEGEKDFKNKEKS